MALRRSLIGAWVGSCCQTIEQLQCVHARSWRAGVEVCWKRCAMLRKPRIGIQVHSRRPLRSCVGASVGVLCKLLQVEVAPPWAASNRPPMHRHCEWVGAERTKLECLSKVVHVSDTIILPPKLNVNPCALFLKARPEVDDDAHPRQTF